MDLSDDEVERLMRTFYKYKAMDEVGNKISNRIFNDGTDKLRHEDLELSILERKRALGMPLSSSDYPEGEKSFYQKIMPAATKSALSSIPGKPAPFFKVAHAVEDLLPSIGKSPKNGVSNAASIIGRFLNRAASL